MASSCLERCYRYKYFIYKTLMVFVGSVRRLVFLIIIAAVFKYYIYD